MANDLMLRTAYHIDAGPSQMYAVDAQSAVTRHPDEWSFEPWSVDETNAFRRDKHAQAVEAAKAAGRQPPPPPDEVELTDAQQAEIDDDAKARQEARALVAEAERRAQEKADFDAKVAAARGLLQSPPPQPQLEPNRGGAPADSAPQPSSDPGTVDVPDDWRDLSVAKRRAIAIRLGAKPTVKGDEADAMIESEMSRRSGGPTTQIDQSITSASGSSPQVSNPIVPPPSTAPGTASNPSLSPKATGEPS